MEQAIRINNVERAQQIDASIPIEEKCTRHGYINVAMNIDTGDFLCNSCIYDHECVRSSNANTPSNGICGCNLIFLAKLGKDLGREYDEAHRELLSKAKQMEEFSAESIQNQLKERRQIFMEKFKSMVWDLHPKIMNLFRQNPILIELEETLDSVKEYFIDFNGKTYEYSLSPEDAKRGFKEEVEEIEILNKNGHFAYVCSRMDHYKDLERRMDEATVRINKATARAKILVNQLTDFKLNKEFLKKMLSNEFSRRNLNSCDVGDKSSSRLNLIRNAGNQNSNGPSRPVQHQEAKSQVEDASAPKKPTLNQHVEEKKNGVHHIATQPQRPCVNSVSKVTPPRANVPMMPQRVEPPVASENQNNVTHCSPQKPCPSTISQPRSTAMQKSPVSLQKSPASMQKNPASPCKDVVAQSAPQVPVSTIEASVPKSPLKHFKSHLINPKNYYHKTLCPVPA